ncbi:MAG: sugar phosphate isomerase/epimerase family protein [Bryobacteraceae bacterium]
MTRRQLLGAPLAAAIRPTEDAISLAAWSINRSFFVAHKWKNLDLPKICREQLGIPGIEFVNQFFENPTIRYLQQLKKAGADAGVRFVLIMIDQEGDMAAVAKKERQEAAIAHRKWVDIAHYLGCHAIRCNMGGPRQNWKQDGDLVARAAESFRNLLDYAKGAGLNVVIENHGGASSDPAVLTAVMKTVNDPDFGTLPDFGNLNPGDDPAAVLRSLLPWAKGISVKAMWNADGTHPRYDLAALLRICVEAGYHGYWGIESSYARQSENLTHDQIWENELKGVRLTKEAIERTVFKKG